MSKREKGMSKLGNNMREEIWVYERIREIMSNWENDSQLGNNMRDFKVTGKFVELSTITRIV